MADPFDLAVVGGGPGGYTAAIRAAQLGRRVVLVEKDALGGVCGNWGCIPSKAIISAADLYDRASRGGALGIHAEGLSVDFAGVISHSRKAAKRVSRGVGSLMKKNRIDVLSGEARLLAGPGLEVEGHGTVETKNILLATGSSERLLPGMELSPPRVLTSREILEEPTIPESLVVIGGGAIGLEFGWVFSALGVPVTVVEMAPQLLPGLDGEIAHELARVLGRHGMDLRVETAFESMRTDAEGVSVAVRKPDGGAETLRADRCLVAVGRVPRAQEMGIPEAGVWVERGCIQVDDSFQTSVPGVFAIGDLIDSPQLAHVASAEGVRMVEILFGERAPGRLDPRRIPACVYCHPEVATIGLTEEQAVAEGYEVDIGRVPFRALGRAVASGDMEGLVKLVVDRRHKELLGCHVVGPQATDLIATAVATLSAEGTARELGGGVHAHPTFGEALMEGALAAMGEAINL